MTVGMTRLTLTLQRSCKLLSRWKCHRHLPASTRSHSSSQNRPILITTPIFYVNSVPHIGHLYTVLIADAAARWHRLCGRHVIFSTGTDEHGLKIQQAAAARDTTPQALCDDISERFKSLFDQADIQYTEFIRTTEPRHKLAVEKLWRTIAENGFIYRGRYEGWYSTPDESFLGEQQVTTGEDGETVSLESGHTVEWMEEENFLFRLSAFEDKLRAWLEQDVIRTSNYAPLLVKMLEDGLPDLSVSRSTSRLQWGIRVPGSDDQTVYVWMDALTNYLTVGGYPRGEHVWPADCHIVGKDILKFHALYWPAFLMAANLEPPRKIHCHAFWLLNDAKMSKSVGNVVDPCEEIEKFTVDGLRYYLLRAGTPHSDASYDAAKVKERINAELVNTLGNLLSRCTGKAVNPAQIFPAFDGAVFQGMAEREDEKLLADLATLPGAVRGHYENMDFYRAVDAIMDRLRDTNLFIQKHKPWELRKNSSKTAELETVISVALESLRITSILLQPIVPNLSAAILDRLNVPLIKRTYSNTGFENISQKQLGEDKGILIKRIK